MVEINPAEDIHRWSVQQTITILANADYYYTKNEMDIILRRIEGKILSEEQIRAIIDQCTQQFITEAEVDAKLEDYSTKEETEAAIEEAIEHIQLDDYYTKEETDEAIEDAIQGIVLDDYYTKSETDSAITSATANKADLSALTSHTSDSAIHVTVADKNAWNAKLDASDVDGFFGAVRYDSQTKRINFYNETTGGTVLAYIDATDFIKDGMVSNVEIKAVGGETSLVISFNTDAGKEDIVIPISEIFDADNYYTKTEVDGALSNIASDVASVSGSVNTLSGSVESLTGNVNTISGDVSTLSGQVQTNEATLTAHTANTTVHVTAQEKTTWNNKSDFSGDYNDLTNKPTNVSDFTNDAGYVTQTDIDESISGKADTSTVTALSTKVDTNEEVTSRALNEVNDALSGKADTNSVYTKIEVDSALSGKQDTLIAGTNITISGNVISAEGGSITVDSAFSRTSENPVQNKVISNAATNGDGTVSNTGGRYKWEFFSVGGVSTNKGFYLDTINGAPVISKYNNTRNLNLVETSAITSSVTSASTDSQVPSAKAVYDALQEGGSSYTAGDGIDITNDVISVTGKADTSAVTTVASDLTALSGEVATNEEVTSRALNVLNTNMGGLKLMQISQADYEALTVKDPSTLYIILETN